MCVTVCERELCGCDCVCVCVHEREGVVWVCTSAVRCLVLAAAILPHLATKMPVREKKCCITRKNFERFLSTNK